MEVAGTVAAANAVASSQISSLTRSTIASARTTTAGLRRGTRAQPAAVANAVEFPTALDGGPPWPASPPPDLEGLLCSTCRRLVAPP